MATKTSNNLPEDASFMGAALALASRGLGRVWPNPSVGCVIVNNGRVVGRGWTQPGGRPHAETEALRRAGGVNGATAYVTLEPCCHHGQTPPCTNALIEAGVSRVVVAVEDPDKRVSGRGIAALREAGLLVDVGCLEDKARVLNAGFISRVVLGRPMVTLKMATSLDGRIATSSGQSQWITGEAARARGHLLRAEHDGIMVGRGTAQADNPSLTCRLPGCEDRSPVRIVIDSHLSLSPDSHLAKTVVVPTWVVTCSGDTSTLEAQGVEIIRVEEDRGRVHMGAALQALGARGLTRILVEGGGELAASVLRGNLVDRVVWFRAPLAIGGDGRPALGNLGVNALSEAAGFELVRRVNLGDDVMEEFVRVS